MLWAGRTFASCVCVHENEVTPDRKPRHEHWKSRAHFRSDSEASAAASAAEAAAAASPHQQRPSF